MKIIYYACSKLIVAILLIKFSIVLTGVYIERTAHIYYTIIVAKLDTQEQE